MVCLDTDVVYYVLWTVIYGNSLRCNYASMASILRPLWWTNYTNVVSTLRPPLADFLFIEFRFDVSVDFVQSSCSFDDFEYSVPFQVDHSSAEGVIFYLKRGFPFQDKVFYIFVKIHHLKDSYSAFVSGTSAYRTFFSGFGIFSSAYGD